MTALSNLPSLAELRLTCNGMTGISKREYKVNDELIRPVEASDSSGGAR